MVPSLARERMCLPAKWIEAVPSKQLKVQVFASSSLEGESRVFFLRIPVDNGTTI